MISLLGEVTSLLPPGSFTGCLYACSRQVLRDILTAALVLSDVIIPFTDKETKADKG